MKDSNHQDLNKRQIKSEVIVYIILIGVFWLSWVSYSIINTRAFLLSNEINYLPLIFQPHSTVHFYYVDAKNGSDSNPGSETKPWKTIQKAADVVQPGDYVFVRAGNYKGFGLKHSGLPEKMITFAAYPGEMPVLVGDGGDGIHNFDAEQYPLEYFVIDGFEIKYFDNGIYLTEASNFILQNNYIHHNRFSGINIDYGYAGKIQFNTVSDCAVNNGIWLSHSQKMEINHNHSYRNTKNGIGVSENSRNNLIHHNTVFHNSCMQDKNYAGISVEVNSSDNTIYLNLSYENCHSGLVVNSPNNKFYNNVFANNDEFQVLLGDWQGSIPTRNEFKNNIFFFTLESAKAVGFFRSQLVYNPLLNTFDYNLYDYFYGPDKADMVLLIPGLYSFSNWKAAGQEQHGVLGDPKFVNPYLYDFRLLNESPAIDAGANVGLSVDFDLITIPIGAGYDIGAYEKQQ